MSAAALHWWQVAAAVWTSRSDVASSTPRVTSVGRRAAGRGAIDADTDRHMPQGIDKDGAINASYA